MATKSKMAKETRRSKIVKRFAKARAAIKSKIRTSADDIDAMFEAQSQLQKQPRNASKARQRNRCRVCGRPRGVYRKFGLCRIHLREALMRGDVAGGRKSSW